MDATRAVLPHNGCVGEFESCPLCTPFSSRSAHFTVTFRFTYAPSNLFSLYSTVQILGNVAIAACVLLGIGIKQFFLGTLRENEYEVRTYVSVNL